MQSLEIISVNLWQILISLCNLLILFLILKKFLFKPVKKAVADRENAIKQQYEQADSAQKEADSLKAQWESKMLKAEENANAILAEASQNAQKRSDAIIAETNERAERIIKQAENDAELEKKKARAGIKQEIIDVSAALSEKMLAREINTEDHRQMIDTFLSELGEEDDGDK